ncbi:MAG: tRNA lysidine(34) synthetase TilS [Clostridia bacterium]|nr:tRNA lysidine(34) synthetase TilS [Clostridia bacterium]
MEKKVLSTIKEHDLLEKGKKYNLVLGFSGGPDSLALFSCLFELSKAFQKTKGKYGYDLVIWPVHVNHMLRGDDAERDMRFCEDFSKSLFRAYPDMVKPCRTVVFDCSAYAKENHMTDEEAGRKVRYDSFYETAKELENPVICTAQNMNDQAETVLMRIIRGTGLNGLTGIPYMRYERDIPVIRPLLKTERSDIEEYLKEKNLTPCIDHTNSEEIYMRNRVRLSVIPELKSLNPSVLDSLVRLTDALSPVNEYMKAERDRFLSKVDGTEIHVKELEGIHQALRYEIYMGLLERAGMTENITMLNLKKIDSLLGPTDHKVTVIELSGGFRVTKEKKILSFFKEV